MLDKDYLVKGEMYQYNLGWLIEELMSFKQDLATAIDLKTIKYADPIQWDITTQYPANTVVVDPKSGTAYMSKIPVPAGVELNNTNYWVVVFNYQDIYNKIMDGVAFNDRDQDYATKDLLVNDLVWYAGDLYRATREIPAGSKYIPGTNLIKTTIESLLARYYGRDRMAQISNDTVNVSGDYTLAAGDIAETSTNRTIKVTKDREVDVDGSDSVHVDGASTLNVGGLRTEVYAGDKTEGVTGTETTNKNIVNETVNNLTVIGNNELKFKSSSLVLDSNGEPIKLGIGVTDSEYYGTLKVREANGNEREVMVKNNGTSNLARKHGFNTKNVVIIGDSFAGAWYSGYTSYAYLLKDLLKIDTLHVYSIGGAGYLGKGTLAPYSDVTFQEYLDSAFNSEMSAYANDVTMVIIQGGGNDYKQEYNAERTAVKNLITDAKNKFPNADVYGVSGFWLHNMFSDTKNGIINGYNESGAPLFEHGFYTFINHSEYFANDKLHPNALGMTIMANAIANNILYGVTYDCNQGGFIPSEGGGFVWQITSDGMLRGYAVTTKTDIVCDIPKTLQPTENDVFGFAYTGSGAFVALWYNNGQLKVYAPSGVTPAETKGSINWMLNANDNNATG